MRKIAVLVALLGSLCLFSCTKENTTPNPSQSPVTASSPIASSSIDAPIPPFTVCKGTFALCTTAKCKRPEGTPPSLTVKCLCDVKQDYSLGTKSCADVPQGPPQKGQSIPSRYYPINSMAVCAARVVWASCLDSPCTIDDKDPSKARCDCTATESAGPHVVVAATTTDGMCRSDLWSSATLEAVLQVTGFLYAQKPQLLKPLPINIVRVEAHR